MNRFSSNGLSPLPAVLPQTRLQTASQTTLTAPVDFRRSLPPVPPDLKDHIAQAFAAVEKNYDLSLLTHQSIPRGAEEDRVAAGKFLAGRFGGPVAPSRLLITNGTQSAVLTLLKRIVGPRGLMLAERLSYGPVKLLAEVADVQVRGLAIDQDGIIPDAFEDVCRSAYPKALYCNPTVQNPTTAIMPADRRRAIGDIARKYGVAIIEDEALGRLHPDAPPPIATFAPDVTWYIMSTTKCLAHGLRLAYLVAPSAEAAARVVGPLEHLSYWHPAPLLSAMVTQWIDSGAADQISRSITAECVLREQAAREILAGFELESKPGSMHVWITLPKSWSGMGFAAEAERHGVLMRSAELFAADDQPVPNAVRLSLSTPDSLDDVRAGLDIVKALLTRKS